MIHSIMKRKKLFKKNKNIGEKQEGYTIVEILVVTLIIGLNELSRRTFQFFKDKILILFVFALPFL